MAKRKQKTVEIACTQPVVEARQRLNFKASHWQQNEALDCCRDNAIVFLTGPAGSAKTYCATYYAISNVIDTETRYRKVYMTRPAVTQGRDIGFIPGGIDEKMNPFLRPIINAYEKQAGYNPAVIERIKSSLEILPLSYIRGWTIEDSILIVDEAQNLEGHEIKTIATRLGKGGKIIMCGDCSQNDLQRSVLEFAAGDWEGISRGGRSIGWYQFTKDAIVRDPLVTELVDRDCTWG
jgi:phosphate starvation-inducible PhoH-like protein